MNTIIVKTNDATQTVAQVQVVTKDGKPTIIKAMDKVNYEFHDAAIGRAPNHIITKRLKNDLHISFEEDGKESDLIIEGFYDEADSALLGIAEDGEYYYYVPDTGETYDYVTQLETGDVEGQALGGTEYIAAAIPWWIPAAAGLGLVGLIAGSSSSNAAEDNPPVAEDDTAQGETGQSVTIDVVANDSDSENDLDPTTVKLIDPVTGDEVTNLVIDGEGEWSVDATTGEVTFTPETGFTADPTPVNYIVSDQSGEKSNEASITVDYPQNPPVAEDDTAQGETGQPVTIDVVANDSDSENDLDPTSVKLIDPVTGDEVTNLVIDGEGEWSVDATTGKVTFTPENGFINDPTPVNYVVSDKNGEQSDEASITVDYPLIVSITGTESLNETAINGSPNEAIYTINLSKPSSEDTVVTVTIGGGSTEGSEDYTAPVTKTVTIPAGQTSVDFSVPIVDDSIFEGPEDFDVTVSAVTSGTATIGPTNNVNTTIYDDGTTDGTTPVDPNNPIVGGDKPVVGIVATKPEAVEGETDNDTLEFTVSQNNLSDFDTTVEVTLNAGNSKIEAADISSIVYTDIDGTEITLSSQTDIQDFLDNGVSVKIPAGSTAAPVITINVADDAIYEQSEDLTLNISNPTNATVGPVNSATGTISDEDNGDTTDGSITDGDKPVVSIVATTPEATEGAADNTLAFTISQDNV
ncbi:Ig-like domain-containing protein, partial [Psychrobacter sp. NPDC078631]|uniref:Ig-like domain-containing protein n=1 Tax=Psychrobacter sp. NPDC078631 TaxID=3390666 RepID=UPI003CFF2AC2